MIFRQLFDAETSTYTYLLADEASHEGLLIDPVIDQVERDVQLLNELGVKLEYTLETHVHADHITGSATLRAKLGSQVVLSERSGSGQADLYVKDGDHLSIGGIRVEVRETPGHTDGCLTYVLSDPPMAFTGDALLIRGCGRTDFQQGSARTLYHSIHEKIFTLPDETAIYPGHDYRGRTMSTVGEEKRFNPRLGGGKTEAQFVAIMEALNLDRPKKIDEAVPANLYAGGPVPQDVVEEQPSERGWAPIARSAGGIPEVSCEWVRTHPTVARLVDVREQDEFVGELGHLEGAELVPMARVTRDAEAWDREQPLVLVCRSGGRSGKIAVQLEAMGFKRVVSMAGGMRAFRAQPAF